MKDRIQTFPTADVPFGRVTAVKIFDSVEDGKLILEGDLNELFVIVRVGIYDHGIVGVATDIEEAKQIAEKYAAEEKDSYHDFEIRRSSGGEFDVEVGTLASKPRFGTFERLKKQRAWKWKCQ